MLCDDFFFFDFFFSLYAARFSAANFLDASVLTMFCSSRADQCDAIENGYSTRLEGDGFDAPC